MPLTKETKPNQTEIFPRYWSFLLRHLCERILANISIYVSTDDQNVVFGNISDKRR